jgi:hypothetical protein
LAAGEWGRLGGHGALIAGGDGDDDQEKRGAPADRFPGLVQRPLAWSAKDNMTIPLTDTFPEAANSGCSMLVMGETAEPPAASRAATPEISQLRSGWSGWLPEIRPVGTWEEPGPEVSAVPTGRKNSRPDPQPPCGWLLSKVASRPPAVLPITNDEEPRKYGESVS